MGGAMGNSLGRALTHDPDTDYGIVHIAVKLAVSE